jgi:histone-lysine N-methyltransferase SETMAR
MKYVLLLHNNALPHTSLSTHKAITRVRWTVLPHPAHSPDLASSNYHLFGPVKDALCGCHYADDTELKQSFHELFQSQGREFYNNGIQHLMQHWQKCVENDEDFVEK